MQPVITLTALALAVGAVVSATFPATMTRTRVGGSHAEAAHAVTSALEAWIDQDGEPRGKLRELPDAVLRPDLRIARDALSPFTGPWGEQIRVCGIADFDPLATTLSEPVAFGVSAGPDLSFATTCEGLRSKLRQTSSGQPVRLQAAGQAQGDDVVVEVPVSRGRIAASTGQGAAQAVAEPAPAASLTTSGENPFFADPVGTFAALSQLDTSNIPDGQTRMVLDAGIAHRFVRATGTWQPLALTGPALPKLETVAYPCYGVGVLVEETVLPSGVTVPAFCVSAGLVRNIRGGRGTATTHASTQWRYSKIPEMRYTRLPLNHYTWGTHDRTGGPLQPTLVTFVEAESLCKSFSDLTGVITWQQWLAIAHQIERQPENWQNGRLKSEPGYWDCDGNPAAPGTQRVICGDQNQPGLLLASGDRISNFTGGAPKWIAQAPATMPLMLAVNAAYPSTAYPDMAAHVLPTTTSESRVYSLTDPLTPPPSGWAAGQSQTGTVTATDNALSLTWLGNNPDAFPETANATAAMGLGRIVLNRGGDRTTVGTNAFHVLAGMEGPYSLDVVLSPTFPIYGAVKCTTPLRYDAKLLPVERDSSMKFEKP